MANNKKVYVPGELEVVTTDGKLAPTRQLYDENYNKFQSELNSEMKSITDQMQIAIDGGSIQLTSDPDDIVEGGSKVPNANAVAQKIEESMLDVDQQIIEDSTNPVSGGAVFSGLSDKQDTISDLDEIRSNATSGALAYQLPMGGIPKTDMSSEVQASLDKADSSILEETDPTVPSWAKLDSKPSYDYSEILNTPLLSNVATSGDYNDLNNKPAIPVVPTTVSSFTNDANYLNASQVAAAVLTETQAREAAVSGETSARQAADAVLLGFITNLQNALVNYYLKTETYNRSEINAMVGAISTFQAKVVNTLPTPTIDTTGFIYLIPSTTSQTLNVKEEYITVLESSTYKWEHIGSTNIDLSPYYTSEQTDQAISTALSAYTTTQLLTALLAQKQDVIDSSHKLSADLVDDTNTTHKFTSASEKATWNGKQNAIDATHKLNADLVDDTTSTNKFTNTTEKAAWNGKYAKPQTGIPSTDMEQSVQDTLGAVSGKAEKNEMSITPGTGVDADKTTIQLKDQLSTTVLTEHQNISGKADKDIDAVEGNVAEFDINGNPIDSGIPSNNVAQKDGYYETLGAGTATNLKGDQVKNDMFVYRPTAGSTDVASGGAVLEGIKGNTVKFNQLIQNGDFSNGTTGWTIQEMASYSVVDGVFQGHTTKQSYNHYVWNRYAAMGIPAGHKVYFSFYYSSNSVSNGLVMVVENSNQGTYLYNYSLGGTYQRHSTIKSLDVVLNSICIRFANTGIQYDVKIANIMLIDLTEMFGAGNEPSTVEAFESWLSTNLGLRDYYPYNAGELIPVKMTGLKTNGFNQYNNDNPTSAIKAFTGEDYQITGTYTKLWESYAATVSFTAYTYGGTVTVGTAYSNDGNHYMCNKSVAAYDNTATYALGDYCTQNDTIYKSNVAIDTAEEFDSTKWDAISDIAAMVTEGILTSMDITPDSNGKFVPTKNYLHVDGGNNTTCVHFVCSGANDGESEAYWEKIKNVPITSLTGKLNGQGNSVTVFSDGMKKAGNVYDEIVNEGGVTKAIKRICSVDLGTLDWTTDVTYTTGLYRMRTSLTKYAKKIPNNEVPNIVCIRYIAATENNNYNNTQSVAIRPSGNFLDIYDVEYNTVSSLQSFKTVMNGVMLYYELATPEVYILDDFELPMGYKVDDYGTEEILTPTPVSNELTSCAPTLSLRYGLNAADTIRNLSNNYVSATEEQAFSDNEKSQARRNINAVSQSDFDALVDRTRNMDGRYTSYVVNQTEVDGNARLPEDIIRIAKPSMSNDEVVLLNGEVVFKDVIRRIRANSHLYIGKFNTTTGKLEIKLVDDTDKTKFADGTTIDWANNSEWDLFMKLPKFWWKCVMLAEDIYEIFFCMTEEDADETWNCWNGDTFIGVYEGIISDNKLYSRSGVTPTVNQSWTTFTADARARYSNNNYRLVTYEAHQIMVLLGLGWLGNTDSQSIIGKGTESYPKTTGLCNSKGMTDSSVSGDGNSTSINFWGLENWWGDIAEWVDNLKTKNSTGTVSILGDDRTTEVRTASCPNVSQNSYSNRCTTKLQFGTNGDVLAKKIIDNGNYNKGFCDYGRVISGAGLVAYRSGTTAVLSGGLAYLSVSSGADYVNAAFGSRLLYKGDYEIVDSFAA